MPAIDSRKLLSLYYYSSGAHEPALEVLRDLRVVAPDDVEIVENTGVLLRSLGRHEEAVDALLEAHRRDPSRFNVCDALAHTFNTLEKREEMLRFGRRSLELKDAAAQKVKPLREIAGTSPPAYDPGSGRKRVLSFSLWGDHPRYLRGAVRNVQAAFDLYPGWVCRFYCDDSVPVSIREWLVRHGAEVVLRNRPVHFFDGLLWRFEVIADPTVDRYLVRDCDSVVSVQERVAVDEWLASDRWFHVMRDFPSHTEVILAGMWGGVVGGLPGLQELRDSFRPDTAPTRTFDQVFLRECVWPIARQSVLIHDSVYTGCLGSRDFPGLGRLPESFHVGQNEAAVRKDVVVDLPAAKPGERSPVLILTGADFGSVREVAGVLEEGEGVSVLNRGTLSGLARAAGEAWSSFLGSETPGSGDVDAISAMLLPGILEVACRKRQEKSRDAILLIDDRNDLGELVGIARSIGARLLCVIRDPRDTASLRRISDVEEAKRWAGDWRKSIETIGIQSRACAGTVELVRYEDFEETRFAATSRRLAKFLGRPDLTWKGVPAPVIEKGKPLPEDLAGMIESTAGDLMRKLRYL